MNNEFDVVVVGAGFGGLYAVHHLRELGHRVVALEKGDGVGGTWYWNRYPGARCDVPSLEYSFGFSKELVEKWDWTEFMAGQEEIERYLNFVADHLELRRDIRLGVEVTRCEFDEAAAVWNVDAADGSHYQGTFLVMAAGSLSVPVDPKLPNADSFAGTWLTTSHYPRNRPDLSSSRVGLIGTGSSGVQAFTALVEEAAHVTVFQRTASYVFPSHNRPMDPAMQQRARDLHEQLRPLQRQTPLGLGGFAGFTGPPQGTEPILGSTVEQRLAVLEQKGWMASRVWSDALQDPEANEMAADMYREMIRRTVDDPEIAEALCPRGLPMGCKRVILANGYFDAYNRENVALLDLRSDPLVTVTPNGIRTEKGDHDLDVIVLATGFDGMTGALTAMPIVGRGGEALSDVWEGRGVETLLGLQVAGFPNMFIPSGPGSTSVLSNVVVNLEHHIELVGDLIAEMRRRGARAVEPSVAAQRGWSKRVNELAEGTMYTAANCHSWYLGSNVEGKRRQLLAYVGGFDRYVRECDVMVADGYSGFEFA
ncbi:flavin-containing monooxygenase [Mycolicibacterium moriokaense]|uniref:Cyclohexanone monooxygenase n=1 Tax=Mycolicibacterium moriokaense TaxID=39691 RepID=A0A318HBL7_9MYCO|nr:NAD(P)/FAD-dependent oxidoreductase [Mycolicibacterium moriokaense]PXX01677.1 cyclohexanone monooxygenase [Mycolicibacterium moriokaense]